jgi:DeoR family transcriptional regulator of aga operon
MEARSLGPADAQAPVELRQERIAQLVEARGFARVSDLSTRFAVSAVTVRTDLQALEARGRLSRIRGGAVPADVLRSERPFEITERDLATEKADIGAHAAGLVANGDTVIMDVGTTTTAIARALIARSELREVTVFTNALNIAMELEVAHPRIQVVVTGGTVRPLQHSLVNPLATQLIADIRATVAFIGCNGIDVHTGVTNINLPEAEVKRAMLLAARRRVIVADGSKLGETELAKVCGIEEVSLLVTDRTADPEVIGQLVSAGCRVEVAQEARGARIARRNVRGGGSA